MVQLNKILVAFDGSENGLKALDAAEKLTIDNNAQLTVAYVHDAPLEHPINLSTTTTGDGFLYMDPGPLINNAPIEPVEEEIIIVEEDLPNQVITLAKSKLANIQNVTYEKLTGKAAEEIVNYAISNDMDLIVIGNRGIGAIEKFVTGSVSDKVTNHAECSVFIVK